MNSPKNKIRGEIFNVGSDAQNVTMENLANQIVNAIGKPCEIVIQGTNDHRSYFASFDKIKNTLGFITDYTIKDGAAEIYQELINNNISDDIKTKTVDWYKYLLKNNKAAENVLINNTLL